MGFELRIENDGESKLNSRLERCLWNIGDIVKLIASYEDQAKAA
jgi:hypothetical protein